jgi:hypothetical protein
MPENSSSTHVPPSLMILKEQRSHLLFVLSNAKTGKEDEFLAWYKETARDAVLSQPNILKASHFAEDTIDVTGGAFPKPQYCYLALYELSVDGAEQAGESIEAISSLYSGSGCAEAPATWLHFALGEKVGISTPDAPGVTIAYANGLPGRENEFREWYTTRHIRHALNIPALASGQCFERTQFQRPGALEPQYHIVAVYEQTGSTQSIVDTFSALPPETFAFPTLDLTRFAEVAYKLIA